MYSSRIMCMVSLPITQPLVANTLPVAHLQVAKVTYIKKSYITCAVIIQLQLYLYVYDYVACSVLHTIHRLSDIL